MWIAFWTCILTVAVVAAFGLTYEYFMSRAEREGATEVNDRSKLNALGVAAAVLLVFSLGVGYTTSCTEGRVETNVFFAVLANILQGDLCN